MEGFTGKMCMSNTLLFRGGWLMLLIVLFGLVEDFESLVRRLIHFLTLDVILCVLFLCHFTTSTMLGLNILQYFMGNIMCYQRWSLANRPHLEYPSSNNTLKTKIPWSSNHADIHRYLQTSDDWADACCTQREPALQQTTHVVIRA